MKCMRRCMLEINEPIGKSSSDCESVDILNQKPLGHQTSRKHRPQNPIEPSSAICDSYSKKEERCRCV